MLLFGGVLASWVDDNHQVSVRVALYLAIVPWSYGMWGVLMMASASFNALGKPIPSTILSFTRMFFVYVPLAVTFNGPYGYQGIFIATAISNVVMGVAGYIWFRRAIFGRSDIAQQSTRRSAI
jgi:Na+-driven multidrug efflux pump